MSRRPRPAPLPESDLPLSSVEIAAVEWEVFRDGLVWAIRRSYVDHVTLQLSERVCIALRQAGLCRKKRTKTPVLILFPHETLLWASAALLRAVHEAEHAVQYFEKRTVDERAAFILTATLVAAKLEADNRKSIVDHIADLG